MASISGSHSVGSQSVPSKSLSSRLVNVTGSLGSAVPQPSFPDPTPAMGGAEHHSHGLPTLQGNSETPASAARLDRRRWLATATAGMTAVGIGGLTFASAPSQTSGAASSIKLGFDNFAVRAMNWKAPELIEYAAKLKIDSLFISDLDALGDLATPNLKTIRQRAADAGLDLHLGTWSICPTSTTFRDKWGTAEEHLRLAIRAAHDLGSPVIRVILGNGADRQTPGGIKARIADTAKVCRACRNQAMDSGVKIAVENHAGDMQAHEVVQLIEEAGKEFVGANLDSGNATWTLEDPIANLEVLGPYALTTSLRDSAVWESENGATVQWTAMGDGNVDLKRYFERFRALCPTVPVHIETISGFNREIPYLKPEFWAAYNDVRASDFAKFVALAKSGKPRSPWSAPEGVDRKQAEQDYQKSEIERSLKHCREVLGLGVRKA